MHKALRKIRYIPNSAGRAMVVVFGMAAIGSLLLVFSHAAGISVFSEAENGSIASPAQKIGLTGASAGQVLQFGTSTSPPPVGTWPSTPPAKICTTQNWNNGPTTAPAGAITVAAGNNSGVNFSQTNKTFWFAPGVHTLGTGSFGQVVPGSGSTYIGAPGAIIDGQNSNLYAFAGGATNVRVAYLEIRNFGTGLSNNNEGVINHDPSDNWTMEYLYAHDNDGAAVFMGSNNIVRYSCLKNNGQYGFSMWKPQGITNVTIDHNEIVGNNQDDWETRINGCGCTGAGKFWDVRGGYFTNNYVHDNLSVGFWADTNNIDFLVEGNWFEGNTDEAIWYEISYNLIIRNNVLKRNALVKGKSFADSGDNFPVAAIYLSEAGGDSRVAGPSVLEVYNNYLEDNYGGITLWENADRFCNSPANTSSGECTKVNPAVTLATCSSGTINNAPYYSDCRWKTQNVSIHNNEFHVNTSNISASCRNNWCARMSMLSNYGTYPSWSPYKGSVISTAITYNQNNRFTNNKYFGAWQFMPFSTDTSATWAQWRASPYNQDAGSTIQ